MKKRTIPEAGKVDWTATGSFLHKPKQGWFHSNEDIARGVTYRALVSLKSATCIVSAFFGAYLFACSQVLCYCISLHVKTWGQFASAYLFLESIPSRPEKQKRKGNSTSCMLDHISIWSAIVNGCLPFECIPNCIIDIPLCEIPSNGLVI